MIGLMFHIVDRTAIESLKIRIGQLRRDFAFKGGTN
jgi:hypothetical protein